MFSFTRSRPVLGAAVLAVAAGCADQATVTAPSRSFSSPAPFSAENLSRVATPISGRHLFVMNGTIPADFGARVQAKGGQVLAIHDQIQVVVTAGLTDADAASLAKNGGVANDFAARWVPTPEELHASVADVTIAPDALPQSPFAAAALGFQWNMSQIHAPEAWQSVTGIPSVHVAILDSGLDPFHPELQGLIDLGASRSFVGSGAAGACQSNADWIDRDFHGTFVGGIVTTNNLVIAGVAPNVRLVAVKVLNDNGVGSFSDIVCGVLYAATVVHAQVINMSLGAAIKGNDKSARTVKTILGRIFVLARNQGTTLISAAGNDTTDLAGGSNGAISIPCEAGPQLCVSATSASDGLASYSNYGRTAIDVAAPGGDDKYLSNPPTQQQLLSQLVLGLCSSRAPLCYSRNTRGELQWNPFVFAAGTSMSAPHVSGLAALLASQAGGNVSPEVIANRIRTNADDIGKPGADTSFGKGRINVARTLGVQ